MNNKEYKAIVKKAAKRFERLQELRSLIEEEKSIQETKLKFVELGII